MHADSHHIRNVFVAILLALLALGLFARTAHSVRGGDPVQAHTFFMAESASHAR